MDVLTSKKNKLSQELNAVLTAEVAAIFAELVRVSKLAEDQASKLAVTQAKLKASIPSSKQVPSSCDASTQSTFAAAAQRGKPKPQAKPKRRPNTRVPEQCILVYPTDKTVTDSSVTQAAVTKAVCPRALKMGIRSVRQIRNGGVKITVQSKEDVSKLGELLSSAEGVDAQTPKPRNPKVIIYDLPGDASVEDVKAALVSQNGDLLRPEDINLLFRLKSKAETSTHWVVEVAPNAFKALKKKRKLFFGWSSVGWREYLKEVRCFNCNRLGHVRRHCKNERTCRKCSGVGHEHKDCTASSPKCGNCTRANDRFKKGIDVGHRVDDPKCPCIIRELDILKAKINYG